MTPTEREEKICHYCAENIPAAAKICPRCRQWLTFLSFRNPMVGVCLVGLPLLGCLILMLSTFDGLMNPRPYYSEFPKAIRILESKLNWAQTSDGLRIYITGIVTNESSTAWRSIEFDTRFYDANGRLIDAANGYTDFTILPGTDSGIRVSVKPFMASNDYSSFKISVSNARTARGPF